MEQYDYIIVGGGSSGCVVANRLVSASKSVLLLEAGLPDMHPYIHIPATFVKVIGSARSFMYESEPQKNADGRKIVVPQGRTLGGGSSLNAMIYIRGQAEDFDEWAGLGCTGWGYEDVLPAFIRAEDNERLAGPFHGTDGPLKVSDPRHRHPISKAFVRAAQEAGHTYNDDFNGARQAGVGFYQTTTFDSRRGSTSVRYLKPIRSNPLFSLRTQAAVSRIVLENGAAVGLEYRMSGGETVQARAREEIILCAGALATPKLLMLSGIGHSDRLGEHGIAVKRHLPGVGENFQDHLAASVYGVTDRPISLLGQDRGLNAIRHGLQYALTRTGLLTSTVIETGCFIDTAGQGRPDIQINVTPALLQGEKRQSMGRHGVSINPCILRPTSRGRVSLRSAAPEDPIIFDAGALETEEDRGTLLRGARAAQDILHAPAFAALGFSELVPGNVSDAELAGYIRGAVKTVYHPAGTCMMGTGPMAVVDPRLRVVGVPRLRIADASIMPTIVSGNTNAACIMIGERCAEFLMQR